MRETSLPVQRSSGHHVCTELGVPLVIPPDLRLHSHHRGGGGAVREGVRPRGWCAVRAPEPREIVEAHKAPIWTERWIGSGLTRPDRVSNTSWPDLAPWTGQWPKMTCFWKCRDSPVTPAYLLPNWSTFLVVKLQWKSLLLLWIEIIETQWPLSCLNNWSSNIGCIRRLNICCNKIFYM